jgi:hypothetical protein
LRLNHATEPPYIYSSFFILSLQFVLFWPIGNQP